MALDVEVPDPPSLRDPQHPGAYEAVDVTEELPSDDHRRDDLAAFLRDGAWERGFEEWAEHTFLNEEEFDIIRDLSVIEAFDFYWDPNQDEVGYRAPTLPDPVPDPYDDVVDRELREGIEGELDDLGRVVSEVLENDYVLRDEESFGFFSEEE